MKRIHQIVLIGLLMLAGSVRAETLRLVFVGDVMLADGPGQLIAAGGDPPAPFARVLADADWEPSGWIPADPDLERLSSELIQAFPMGSADARSFYGADAARPGLALTRWDTKTNWYAPVGRRQVKGAPEEIEAILVRALWDNSRGVETEPAARGGSAR